LIIATNHSLVVLISLLLLSNIANPLLLIPLLKSGIGGLRLFIVPLLDQQQSHQYLQSHLFNRVLKPFIDINSLSLILYLAHLLQNQINLVDLLEVFKLF